jgi:hypothetical protein
LYSIQNTTLLTCQASTFIDNSYSQSPINPVGYALIDTDNPFGVTTSTPVSAEAFDDISITNSVINLQILPAKSVFDIYDIQSGVSIPINTVGNDEILLRQLLSKSEFNVVDVQSGVSIPVDAVSTNELTSNISSSRSSVDISNIQSGVGIPVDAVGSDQLIIPDIKLLTSQSVLQYNINHKNSFTNIDLVLSDVDTVTISSEFLNKNLVERTSSQKTNSLRVLVENSQTVVNYSYWI